MQSRSMKRFLGVAGLALLVLLVLPKAGEDVAPAARAQATPAAPAAPGAPATGSAEARPQADVRTGSSGRGARAVPTLAEVLERQRLRCAALGWGRDPFAGPLVRSTQDGPELVPVPELPHLSGVSLLGTQRRAILDREIVGPGDSLPSGWSVQLIEQGLVTLRFESQVRVLQLGSDP